MAGVLGTKERPQLILVFFAVLFPPLLASIFFFFLWKRPQALYGPDQYDKIKPEEYAKAMRMKLEYVQARQSYERIIEAKDRLINRLPSDLAESLKKTPPPENDRRDVGEIVRERLVEELRSSNIQVELTDFGAPNADLVADQNTTVWKFLDDVYFRISYYYPLDPYTYGDEWILRNVDTGTEIVSAGRDWAKQHNQEEDNRILGDIGINSGSKLRALNLRLQKNHTGGIIYSSYVPDNIDDLRQEVAVLRNMMLISAKTMKNNNISTKPIEECINNYVATHDIKSDLQQRLRDLF
jgi:hypothetical protein